MVQSDHEDHAHMAISVALKDPWPRDIWVSSQGAQVLLDPESLELLSTSDPFKMDSLMATYLQLLEKWLLKVSSSLFFFC